MTLQCFRTVGVLLLFTLLPIRLLAADIPSAAQAQIPNIVNPGLAKQPTFNNPTAGGKTVIAAPAKPVHPSALPEAEKIHFKLTRITFTGNTVFSDAQLQAMVQPSINQIISLADLQGLANKITEKYWEAGYILSRAILPPQQIVSGQVKIQVIEGFISAVSVSGTPGKARSQIQEYGNNILLSKPLNINVLERSLLLSNDIPGTQVKAVLTPSTTVPESSDLTMIADRQLAQGYILYDNYGTRYLGPQEVTVGGNLNSFFTSGDSTAVQAVSTIHTKEMNFLQLTHSELLGASGTRLLVGGSYSKTLPGSILQQLDIDGIARSLFADLYYPWIRTRTQSLSLHTSAYYQNIYTEILQTPLYYDRIRSLVAGTHYDSTDSWHGVNAAGLDYSQGFNILGANNGGMRSRPEGRSNFSKTQMNLSRSQYLSTHFSLYAAAQGQYAFTPLLASEQFGVGGPIFGRGYDPYEISGDHGVAGTVEFRVDTAPGFRVLRAIQYYAFYDAGEVWNIDARISGEPVRATATSTGLGVRFTFTQHFAANLFVAQPLNRPVASAVAVGDNGKAPRGFFQVSAYI